ncbi:MAG: deoxyribodipyrimidine photo-lyase, partial [Litorivicinaceae bacterium]
MTPPVVVWFKRDLRVDDHEALAAAAEDGPIIPLYVVEPDYWTNDFTSGRQWSFLKDSLLNLDVELSNRGQPLWTAIGHVEEVLERLYQRFQFQRLVSHQETGPNWTFKRDLRIKSWCDNHGVIWDEYRQHGVVRGLQERRGWAAQWASLMDQDQASVPMTLVGVGAPPKPAAEVLKGVSITDEFLISSQEGGRDQGI